MTVLIVRTEVGWVVVAKDMVPFEASWDEGWRLGVAMVDAHLATEADTVADKYATTPNATVDRQPVHDSDHMRDVLMRSLGATPKDHP